MVHLPELVVVVFFLLKWNGERRVIVASCCWGAALIVHTVGMEASGATMEIVIMLLVLSMLLETFGWGFLVVEGWKRRGVQDSTKASSVKTR